MHKEPIFTKDFLLDMGVSLCCSLNYFTLLINIVGFASVTYGASSAEAGLAAGLYVLGGLIFRFFLGKYIEMFGRKRILIISLVAAVIMSGMYFVASTLWILFIVRFLHGMCYGISSSCTSDIAAKLIPPSRRGEGLGYFYLAITLAMAVGPYLGLHLGSTGDYSALFTIGMLMYAVSVVFALFMHVPEETLTEDQIKAAKSFSFDNLVQLSAIPLGLTSMVFYFGYSGVLSFIMQFTESTGMESAAGPFYLVVALGTLVSRFSTGRIYDTKGPNVVIIPGTVLFVVGMLMFATTRETSLFLLSGAMMGYGVSIIYAICQAIVVSKSPVHRYGVTSATFGSVSDMGSGFGPFILGSVLAYTGFQGMYMMCACISLFSLFMYWGIHGRKVFRTNRPKGY